MFMARTDVAFQVRGAAVHVWKTLVGNTPKTLGEILPVLMQQLITSLASQGRTFSLNYFCVVFCIYLYMQVHVNV